MVPTNEYLSRRNLRAVSLASLIFLYPVIALSISSVRYIETIHRVTILQVFNASVFGSIEADSLAAMGSGLAFLGLSSRHRSSRIIFGIVFGLSLAAYALNLHALVYGALAILPAVSLLLLAGAIADRRNPLEGGERRIPFDGKRVAIAFLGIVIILEAGALARWIAYPATPGEMYGDSSWHVAKLESALFHSFAILSPVMLVILVFSYPARILLKDFFKGQKEQGISEAEKDELRAISAKIMGNVRADSVASGGPAMQQFSSPVQVTKSPTTARLPEYCMLAASMVLAATITMYPHLQGVNQSGSGISTDERAYLEVVEQLRAAKGLDGLVSSAFSSYGGDRPLSLLTIVGLADLTGLPDEKIIRFLPSVLGPALVIAAYSLVRFGLADSPSLSGKQRRSIAVTTSVMAAVSPQIVVGMYGGFLANWMALVPAFASMLFAVRLFDPRRGDGQGHGRMLLALTLFLALSLTMLFHVYTWGFTVLAVGLFVVITTLSSLRISPSARNTVLQTAVVAISVLVASVAADYAKAEFFGQATGLSRDSLVIGSNFGFSNFGSRWETLGFTLHNYLGGFLSSPVIFALALFWAFGAKMDKNLDRMIFVSLVLLAIPILFGNNVMQARLLHVVPIFIPSVLGVFRFGRGDARLILCIAVAFILSASVYAVRAGANFDLVVPEDFRLDNPFLVQ